MNIFSWFKKKPKVNIENLGIIPDPRSIEEQELDFKAGEIMEFAPLVWKERSEKDWRKYPIFDQDQSSSCLANATAKSLGIENYIEEGKFVHFSPRDIYTRRKNFPNKGMYFKDAMEIGYKYGATLEQLMPSMKKSEEEMNKSNDRKTIDKQIALIGKGGNYFWIPRNIDSIASIIESEKKGIILGVKFGPKEWDRKIPKILGVYAPYGHGVCATNAILYKGKKALVIEDSFGINSGIKGRRIVTEDWFKAGRIIGALYFQKLDNNWRDKEKPSPVKYEFKKDLVWGSQTLDVEALQEILQLEELFPVNVITTGWYLPITAKAVYKFQKKYKVGTPEEIEILKGKRVGPKTRKALNDLYA